LKKLPVKDYSYISLAILWGIFFVGFSVRMAVIITMPLIREDLQISHAQAGMLLSIITASYGLIQFPAGILSDIHDNKKLLIMVTLSLVLALLGVSFSQSLLPFALSLLLTGLFVGFNTPISFSMLSKTFPTRMGTMMGIYNTAPSMAQFFGTYISGVVAITYTWHYVYYIWILLAFILFFLVWHFISTTTTRKDEPLLDVTTLEDFFSNKDLLYFLVPFVAHSVCAFSVLNMNPLYLVEEYALDVPLTATIFGGTRLLGFVGSLLGGFLSDRFSKTKLLLTSIITTTMSIYVFITLPFSFWTVFFLGLQAISINFFFPIIYSLIIRLTSPSTLGKAQGLYNSIAFTIGGLAPYIMGVITDLSSFKLAFLFPILTGFIGIGWILLLLTRGYPKQTI
jgi:ACS family hexuronate transporter-like MFS transporter